MARVPITSQYFDKHRWVFAGGSSAGVGGATSFEILWNDVLPLFTPYGKTLVIDGVSIRLVIAAGDTWYLAIGGEATQYIGNGTAAAATAEVKSFLPLNLPVTAIPNSNMIVVTATFAQADQAIIGAWGHYLPTPEPPQVIPVTVKGVEFFKKVPPKGPV